MTKWVFRAVGLAVLIALGVWGWRILYPSPEQAIRKRLAGLAQAVSISSKAGSLARLSSAQNLTTFCTDDIQITVEIPGHGSQTFHNKGELLEAAAGMMSMVSGLKVQFVDISVRVGPDRTSATADLTAKGNVAGENEMQVQELRFTFRKSGRDWLINRVEMVKTLL